MKIQPLFLKILGIQIIMLLISITLFSVLINPLLDNIETLKTQTEIFESGLPQIDPHNDSQVLELHQALTKKDTVETAYFKVFLFIIFAGIAFAIPLALCCTWQFSIQRKLTFWKLAGIHFGLSLAGIVMMSTAFIILGKTTGAELVTIPIFVLAILIICIGIASLQIYISKHMCSKKHFAKYRLQTILGIFVIFIAWSLLLLINSPQKYIIQGIGLIIAILFALVMLAREKYF